LTPAQQALKLAFLQASLALYSLDQIAEQELDKIYAWPLMKNSALKRTYRNYTLAYTRSELKTLLLISYYGLLGISQPAVGPAPDPDPDPDPAPVPAPPGTTVAPPQDTGDPWDPAINGDGGTPGGGAVGAAAAGA